MAVILSSTLPAKPAKEPKKSQVKAGSEKADDTKKSDAKKS